MEKNTGPHHLQSKPGLKANPVENTWFFSLLTYGRHQDLPRESLSIPPPAKNKDLPCRKETAVEEKAVGEGEVSLRRGHAEPLWSLPGNRGSAPAQCGGARGGGKAETPPAPPPPGR